MTEAIRIGIVGCGSVMREPGELRAHSVLKIGEERRAVLPAHGEEPLDGLVVDRALDIQVRVDLRHLFLRRRRNQRRAFCRDSCRSRCRRVRLPSSAHASN